MNAFRKVGAVFGRPTLSGWVAIIAAIVIIGSGTAGLILLSGGPTSPTAGTANPNVIHAPAATSAATGAPKPKTTQAPTSAPAPQTQQQNAPTLGTSANHAGPTTADKRTWTSPTKVVTPSGKKQTFAPGAVQDPTVKQSQVASEGTVPAGGGTAASATTMDSAAIGTEAAVDVTGTRKLDTLIPVKRDACVEQYVEDNIHTYDTKGAFTVTTVCGHQAVVIGGAAGIEYDTLRGHVNSSDAPATAKGILYGNWPYLNVSAAHTGSGKDNKGTVLIVVTEP